MCFSFLRGKALVENELRVWDGGLGVDSANLAGFRQKKNARVGREWFVVRRGWVNQSVIWD